MTTKSSTDALFEALAEFTTEEKKASSPREERIQEGFACIQRFVEEQGRRPEDVEGRDIFERLYAVRLQAILDSNECRALVEPLDAQGLLKDRALAEKLDPKELSDDALLAALEGATSSSGIKKLKHVRPTSERAIPEEMAQQKVCRDFSKFEPLFEQAKRDLKTEHRITRPFNYQGEASIHSGDWFILHGHLAYVESVGELTLNNNQKRERDGRLRVIYDNGTESNLLMRSLKSALHKDETSRRVLETSFGPLFGDNSEQGDVDSGTIYVLRSLSNDSYVSEHRDLIHKIGVTGGDVHTRIANATKDATYLLADVKVIAIYRLYGVNRTKLESILHQVFSLAQLNITIQDRFGNPVKPREWFLVPLAAIEEAVQKVRDGSIVNVTYNPNTASFE